MARLERLLADPCGIYYRRLSDPLHYEQAEIAGVPARGATWVNGAVALLADPAINGLPPSGYFGSAVVAVAVIITLVGDARMRYGERQGQ